MSRLTFIYINILCFLCFAGQNCKAQTFMPIITNYNSFSYQFGIQNWSCTQDDRGTMYFGNNDGMLIYDGYEWTHAALPNKGIIRSVLADGDRIYVGTYTDFGYFTRDNRGRMTYHSLWPSQYKSHNDEIWNIIKVKDHIYFQSFCSYFDYDGKQVTPYFNNKELPLWFYPARNNVYTQIVNGGISLVKNGKFLPVLSATKVNGDNIMGMYALSGNKTLLITHKQGFFIMEGSEATPVHTSLDAELSRSLVNRTALLNPTTLIVGTIKNGVYAINLNNFQVIWHYNKANGLHNNTVLNLYVDNSKNLWVTLDNGISLIHTGLPLSVMNMEGFGMTYGMSIINNQMYIATNQSVWQYDMEKHQTINVSGCEGQNWYLAAMNTQVFVGNNNGIKNIVGDKSFNLSNTINGSTCLKEYHLFGQHALIESSYTIFHFFRKEGSRWVNRQDINGFSAPIREFEIDNTGVLWAAHMSKGLYRLTLSKDLSRFTKVQYYPSLNNGPEQMFHVMNINGRVVFSYNNGLYTYDDIQKEIVAYKGCGWLSNTGLITSSFIDKNQYWVLNKDGFWLIQSNEQNGHPKAFISSTIFGKEINNYGHAMYTQGANTYFFLNDGIGRYNGKAIRSKRNLYKIFIKEVTTKGKNNHQEYLPIHSNKEDVDSRGNMFFKLSYPNFDNEKLVFCYTLAKNGKKLTEKSSSPTISYNNLDYGNYTFTATVKSLSGEVLSDSIVYQFSYPAPFYLSIWAWFGYAFLLYVCVYGYTRWHINKIVRRNQKVAEAKLMVQKMKVLEQERIIAEQQKILLENELEIKGKETASIAFDMLALKNSMGDVKEQLLSGMHRGTLSSRDVNKILMQMKNQDTDLFWSTFQNNFDLIHKRFFRNLHEKYPELTANDMKICALLRLNLNTKDIANFTHLSIRGVESVRYRLRKKLGIPSEKSLTDFLIELE